MNAIQDIYELSPMQQGMLFHTLYAPETGIYFEQRHCLLEGKLNPQAYKAAWQQVCDRYTVLRSDFHWQEADKPLQVVYDAVELPWHEENWQSISTDEQKRKLDAFLLADRIQGFQIEQAPRMRCALLQLNETQYRFVWSYHHLLMDGWCNAVLIRDVLAVYASGLTSGPTGQKTLPPTSLPPTRPYRDYIVWLQQQDETGAKAYWQKVLRDFDTPTPLGIDRLNVQTGEATEEKGSSDYLQKERFLSREFSADLQAVAQRSRLTLNTILQGAWATLLSRYSGLSDVLYGVTVSGRPPSLAGVESMVGLFINTVPLRVEVTETAELLPWLQALQQTQRDRETYSYSTLPTLQALTQVPSDRPLFESLLIFENYPVSIETATQDLTTDSAIGFSLRDAQGYEQTNYPLTLVVIPGESIQLSLRYDTQCISEAAATRLLSHLETILSSFVNQQSQQLSQINLLTGAEQQQLVEFSAGVSHKNFAGSVSQQFEAQVKQHASDIAIVFSKNEETLDEETLDEKKLDEKRPDEKQPDEKQLDKKSPTDQSLSYHQLNQRANQLAHALRQSGVEKGTRVGICLARSIDMVASLLAVLKLGGIYVPLDPHHPSDRLNYILTNAQAEVLISTTEIEELLFSELSISAPLRAEKLFIFCLDKQSEFIQAQPT